MTSKKIVCLYGGPGSGKSTTCAGLYYVFKSLGIECEMNREYIKEWVWEGREVKEGDQSYFFSKSARRERIYVEQGLDYIFTDSPLLLTHFYGLKYDPMEQLSSTSLVMLKHHWEFIKKHNYKVEHYVIDREKEYQAAGRYQTEEEARQFDVEISEMLDSLGIKYKRVGTKDALNFIVKDLIGEDVTLERKLK